MAEQSSILENLVNFWKSKKVLVTGHTGFKGSWLCLLLYILKSKVIGYALNPPTNPNLFILAGIKNLIHHSEIADLRDFSSLNRIICTYRPDVIFHLAAQSLVLKSYEEPIDTYSTNIMGTVSLLDIARNHGIKCIVNITSDKCYENKEWCWGYRENDPMGGWDPYSSSKGCSELISAAYRRSFGLNIATARAGNVIGGGDWAENRLVPDCIKSLLLNQKIKIRNPYATRPWQHVLDPLLGYLMLARSLYEYGQEFAEGWNFGPDETKTVEWIAQKLCEFWNEGTYQIENIEQNHEANCLKLDCSKAKSRLNWTARWDIETALFKTIEWTKAYKQKKDLKNVCLKQIENFLF